MRGALAQPRAREGHARRRRRHRGLSRGGAAHLAGGRAARRASAALGAPAGFRRVPSLAGRRRGARPPGDALARSGPRRRATSRRSSRRAWSPPSAIPAPAPREIDEAVRAGATLSTHLGNGAHPMIRRHPNYIWDQLAEDRLMADFIVDGIHLPAAFLKAAIRAKGVERSVLVTDAVMPAGCRARALPARRTGCGPDA